MKPGTSAVVAVGNKIAEEAADRMKTNDMRKDQVIEAHNLHLGRP